MAEPVTLEQMKLHLRVDGDEEDALISALGIAAREWVENYTGLTLIRREVVETFAGFGAVRTLAAWPVAEGAMPAVSYGRPGVAPLAIGGAIVATFGRPAYVYPAAGTRWPVSEDPVTITIAAGYLPDEVPASLVAAILLLVGNLYAQRETTVTGVSVADTGVVEMLCRPYRLPVIG